MAGIKKFDTLEAACKALGVSEVNDANREVLMGLVKSANTGAVSETKKELFEYLDAIGLADGTTVMVEGETVVFARNGETTLAIKVIVAHWMRETENEALAKYLEDNNWAFSEVVGEEDKLYRLKKKATPVSDRELPTKGTIGATIMEMVGNKEYGSKEFAEIAAIMAERGTPTTEKTVAFYDNFAFHRKADCAEAFGNGWNYIRRPSVIKKDYAGELDLETARIRRTNTPAAATTEAATTEETKTEE